MKKSLIPVLAVAVATFSAFATKPTASMFRFDSATSASWEERVDPTNYSKVTPTGCSSSEVNLCSIQAVENGTTGKPLIEPGTLYDALKNSEGTEPDFDHVDIQGKP